MKKEGFGGRRRRIRPRTRRARPVAAASPRSGRWPRSGDAGLVRALAAGPDPGSETAAAHAATRVRTASLDEDSQDVAQRMLEAGVRHLPVEDGGRPVGMVSMRDLLALEVWSG